MKPVLKEAGLTLAVTILFLPVVFIAAVFLISQIATCRGIECLNNPEFADRRSENEYSLRMACAVLGAPTGTGSFFADHSLGSIARDQLGMEYLFLGREFLLLKIKDRQDLPIAVINAGTHRIEMPQSELCGDQVLVLVDPQSRQVAVSSAK